MSFVANKIIQFIRSGDPVDVTDLDPMPVKLNAAATEVLLEEILKELKIINLYNSIGYGDILTEEDLE